MNGRCLVLVGAFCLTGAACTDCSWAIDGRKVRSGVYVNETQYIPLYAEPPTSALDPSPVTDTSDWPEPVSTVLIVDREAGTVIMRHAEPDGRLVERFFRIGVPDVAEDGT